MQKRSLRYRRKLFPEWIGTIEKRYIIWVLKVSAANEARLDRESYPRHAPGVELLNSQNFNTTFSEHMAGCAAHAAESQNDHIKASHSPIMTQRGGWCFIKFS